jgi:hypothetical protein
MNKRSFVPCLILFASAVSAQDMTLDTSGVRPGAVQVHNVNGGFQVEWPDERGRMWTALFALDARKPLITSIGVGGTIVMTGGQPFYRAETGKRRGGGLRWDAARHFRGSDPVHLLPRQQID